MEILELGADGSFDISSPIPKIPTRKPPSSPVRQKNEPVVETNQLEVLFNALKPKEYKVVHNSAKNLLLLLFKLEDEETLESVKFLPNLSVENSDSFSIGKLSINSILNESKNAQYIDIVVSVKGDKGLEERLSRIKSDIRIPYAG